MDEAKPTVGAALPVEFWTVATPNFIRTRETDYIADMAIPLKEVPDVAFHALVRIWVDEMYAKAGKTQPPTAR
jgi:hypothetical protein